MYNFLKSNRLKILVIPLIFYWILLFIATSLPSDHISTVIDMSDKLKHFTAYFILSFLLSLNLHFQERWKGLAINYLLYTFIICSLYGVLDELHQIFVPNRFAEFYDWVADLFGTITGVFVSFIAIKIFKNNSVDYETN